MTNRKHWFWPALKALFLAAIFYRFARSFFKMALKLELYEVRKLNKQKQKEVS